MRDPSFLWRWRRRPPSPPSAEVDVTAEGDPADAAGSPGGERPVRLVVARVTTVLAGVLVLFALVAPSQVGQLTPAGFVRIPVEAIIAVGLVLVLPVRAGRIVAALAGAALGVVAVLNVIDMGFYFAFARPFHPVFDWSFLGPAVDFVARSLGRTGAAVVTVVAVILAVAVPILTTLSAVRLTSVVARHRTTAARTAAVLGIVWVTCAAFAVQIVPGLPVASTNAAGLAYDQAREIGADLQDQQNFAAEIPVDAFRDTPPEQMLTALRGKDVLIVFVESYGRCAVESPEIAPQIDALLDAGDRRLRAAGFASRSAFLTSPVAGGGSWLPHSTLQSGLWVDNQGRYRSLIASDRLTLNSAFRRAGWRTVGVLPANRDDWPEGAFYGFDQIYDDRNIGYRGPPFSFASIPDQYTMSAFQRSERAKPDRAPVMAEIDLLSSHAPWEPVPPLIDWADVGDGSAYRVPSGAGDPADAVLARDAARVRADYARSIEYSLNTLISYVETYGDDNLVLLFLGDHQPAPVVAGAGANRDAPVTIVARDPAVLDRISGWGWQDGLKPNLQAPVWRMDAFRDRFLAAFGSQAVPGPGQSVSPTPR